jgi:hypothetical protein
VRRDAIVEVIEVKSLSIADVPEVVPNREEQPAPELPSPPSPVQA